MRAVALLRGVNVGGKARVPMGELRELVEGVGLADVETYVQSGNFAFSSPRPNAESLATSLEKEIAAAFGVQTKVLIRTARQLAALEHPFLADEAEHARLHVLFLRDRPGTAEVRRLDPERSPPDRFEVKGREIFVHYPNGAGRSKLTTDYFERTLGAVGTARNWKTVLRLKELVAQA
jgi:uncharacterized protein (DUF1697 family)